MKFFKSRLAPWPKVLTFSRCWAAGLAYICVLAAVGVTYSSNAATVVISEFMAENDGGYRDQDGDSSDWIELHNSSAASVDLAGWHLTDNPTNLTKWTFPPVNVPAGGY